MRNLISAIISITIIIFMIIGLNSIDAITSEGSFGIGIMIIGVYAMSYLLFKAILNQIARVIPCSVLGCYLPKKKKYRHTCKCGKKWIVTWGRVFGGYGEYWEEVK